MISKSFRLLRSDIEWVLKKGNQLAIDLFIIKFLKEKSQDSIPHFSVIVSAKLSAKAVERNRLKRRIFEAIRANALNQNSLPFKIVIIPKKKALKADYKEIEKGILSLTKKLNG
jgi:ribonuclease P protein component